tara:strand:- start:973 stop:1215 length:243 start_codon:yes stop_codon:yes gene_type:complete
MTNEINDEILNILMKMAKRLEHIEDVVFNQDNILLKAGLVRAGTPAPKIDNKTSAMPDGDMINKMDWDQLDNLAKKITGE